MAPIIGGFILKNIVYFGIGLTGGAKNNSGIQRKGMVHAALSGTTTRDICPSLRYGKT
ncbi:hypothetical protein ADIS_4774 [Lunatimonas lonarensis]|uniref:Uncharacterized protein n=1 Tax=Lunatimonas lonarensis TaxID=1232681 RepID=R7ZKY5_9BACT|nr:hypothetical protein ADIS_4774 [Lunatimonas lonarensis]